MLAHPVEELCGDSPLLLGTLCCRAVVIFGALCAAQPHTIADMSRVVEIDFLALVLAKHFAPTRRQVIERHRNLHYQRTLSLTPIMLPLMRYIIAVGIDAGGS